VPVALLCALAVPGAAQASATLSVAGVAPHKTLTLTAGDAGGDGVSASVKNGVLVISDGSGLAAGTSPCTVVEAITADCGAAADYDRIVFTFGDGDDVLLVNDDLAMAVTADGGAGSDLLQGGAGDDHLVGGPGANQLQGGQGEDELIGGPADDDLWGGEGDDELVGGAGADRLYGGNGVDVVDAGEGDDYVYAIDSPPTTDAAISCGPGTDVVEDDDVDELADDCELYEPPYLDGEVRITGTPQVGSALGLSLPTNIGGDGVATIQWELCTASGDDCSDVFGENGPTFTPIPADQGARVRARYTVRNALGEDWVESEATDIVAGAAGAVPTPHPHPTPRPPRQRRPVVARPTPVLGPFLVARAPSFAIRNGKPLVDTGRSIRCMGAPSVSCQLSVTARPSGASARLRGRPAIAGGTHVPVAGGVQKKVMFSLNGRAYRLLRAHRKLTLSVTAVLTRPGYVSSQATFTITIKAPARRKH
jgi:Ca2+-binding RTX toxin-like protein